MVPPNNWVSLFGGSAWEWVASGKQFYFHKFYNEQPDLNWRNPAVEATMFGVSVSSFYFRTVTVCSPSM